MTRTELLEQIAAKAREMRAAQRAYFAASRAGASRGPELDLARRLERELDALLDQAADPDPAQRSLFLPPLPSPPAPEARATAQARGSRRWRHPR